MPGPEPVIKFGLPEDKLTRYLLNIAHPKGKAGFFIGVGFDPSDPDTLASALFHHLFAPTSETNSKPHPLGFGDNIKVVGPLLSPDGRNPNVLAIWLVDPKTNVGSFVTAYPN